MTEKNEILVESGMLVYGTDLPDWTFRFARKDQEIVHVSCGPDHSAVIFESGGAYIFGKDLNKPEIEFIFRLSSFVQAACGYRFTMLLTDDGKVFSCGLNMYGQLGLGHTRKNVSPTQVTGLPPIKKIAAEYQHAVVLTETGGVWVAGHNGDSNKYGQLGLGHTGNRTSFACVPNLPEAIIDISCGWLHTVLLSVSGVILITGCNGLGQLGLGQNIQLTIFKRVTIPMTVVTAVSCGFHHTVALGFDGSVWTWGYNKNGQLGTGDVDKRFTPTQIIGLENCKISKIFAGCNHTALLTEEGNLWTCGRGENGELGQGMEDLLVPTLLPKLPDVAVAQVAFARNYSLMLFVPQTIIAPAPKLARQVTFHIDEVRGEISDWEESVIKSLECPVCCKLMCAPINQCVNGHCLCNACWSHDDTKVCPTCRGAFIPTKCLVLQNLSAEMYLPCIDCLERMPTCQLERHAVVCPERKYGCPLKQSCGWSGRPMTMLAHTSSVHPNQTWRDLPQMFLHSLEDEQLQTNVLAAHNEVFTLHRRYKKITGEFQAVVKYIGPPENRSKFKFQLTFVIDRMNTTFCRNVCCDFKSINKLFASPCKGLTVSKALLDPFIQQSYLMCRAAIVLAKPSDCSDQFKALLSACVPT